jgi:aspartyl-tRNA(Asn)/glutamyl-tRNA(Gln) amidotransferase subunit B
MEKGQMRCEANVSVRPAGQQAFGTKVEIKNLNSFRAVKQSLDYEVARQTALLEVGRQVVQVTMGWDEEHGHTVVQRVKESSDDYRYFPEPDLPPLSPLRAWVAEIEARLPELPDAKAERFVVQLGLDRRDASLLVAERAVAEYFEAVAQAAQRRELGLQLRNIANWITGELFRLMNAAGRSIAAVPVTPEQFAELLALTAAGKVNLNSAKKVLGIMFETGRPAADVVQELGLVQVSDSGAVSQVVARVLERYPDEIAKYRAGKGGMLDWLMGQVMRESRGKANPNVVRELLQKALAEG